MALKAPPPASTLSVPLASGRALSTKAHDRNEVEC